MQLTPSQTKALSTERHLAITANAGSGKTRILVERYVNLFESRTDLAPRNVVAITFTENAAAELRTRILKEVKKRLEEVPPEEQARRTRLATIRDGLSSAFIGTIHGFATRIIKAYPVEAGVDAGFGILSGADQNLFVEDAIESTFYTALEDAYANNAETPVLTFFRAVGRQEATDLVCALLSNRARTTTLRDQVLAKTDTEIISMWKAKTLEMFAPFLDADLPARMRALRPHAKPGALGKAMLPVIDAYFASEIGYDRLVKGMAMIALASNDPANRFDLTPVSQVTADAHTRLVDTYRGMKDDLPKLPSTELAWDESHKRYLDLTRAAFELYDSVLLEYESSKSRNALLDFDDLIMRLHRLLKEPRVCEELASQFQYIMIDEYQDTDASQFELASMLTRSFGSGNNLAIVGDPKQSIYSFRNADATVFRRTEQSIRDQVLQTSAAQEAKLLGIGPDEEHGEISLEESFRMAEQPLGVINLLFRVVMGAGAARYCEDTGTTYSELVLGRIPEHSVPERSALTRGSVEILCPPKVVARKGGAATDGNADAKSEDDPSPDENELIALKIKQFVRSTDQARWIEDHGAMRQARYDDIAILLRSRTRLPALEATLRHEGVPYAVASGTGFYAQQEILDIAAYLQFLAVPGDDVALAGVLRSPYFAISDVDLFKMQVHTKHAAGTAGHMDLWTRLQAYATMPGSENVHRAVTQLRANRELAGRTSAAQLIERIYAESSIYTTIRSGPNGEQKVANLEKFLSHARGSDMSGFSSLFDFVDRVNYLISQEEKESQADFPSESRGVRILTVHSAKGLEFPIVFVPFLDKQFMFDSANLIDKELGVQLPVEEDKSGIFIPKLMKLRADERTTAEEQRVFYVAVTRARDHLVLSSAIPEKPKAASWLAWTVAAMPEIQDGTVDSVERDESMRCYDSETRQTNTSTVHLSVPLIRKKDQIAVEPEVEIETDSVLTLGELKLSPITAPQRTSRFSPTQFLQFRECEMKYYLSYVLGLPEELKLALEVSAGDALTSVRGDLVGRIVHKLLEHATEFLHEGAGSYSINEAEYKELLERTFSELRLLTDQERQPYLEIVRSHIERFSRSEIAKESLTAKQRYTEYELQTTFETGDTLRGIIDCLYRSPSTGRWTVLDHKTGQAPEGQHRNESIARFRMQLLVYAYLVHRAHGIDEEIDACIGLTSSGEVIRFTFGTADFIQLREEILTMIQGIRRLDGGMIKSLAEISQDRDHCGHCRYYDVGRGACVADGTEGPH